MNRLAAVLAFALFAGCTVSSPASTSFAVAPLDSTADVADHECRVVLRKVDRLVDRTTGVVLTIDVANALIASPGGTPGALYAADGNGWQSVDASPASAQPGDFGTPPAGFTRYLVRIPVITSIDLIAEFTTTTGVRLFDHNRFAGDFDNVHLDASNGFTLAESPAECPGLPPVGELDFQIGWTQSQRGPIVAGGKLAIDYALERLTTCRDTHDGYRFWTLDAWVRFDPAGETSSATVVQSNGPQVFPTTATFDVPADAQSVEVWFKNASPPSCAGWDSNEGQNYRFPVLATTPSPIGWAGDWGSSTDRSCVHDPGVPEPITIDEYMRERACIYADADVWVPGVTDVDGGHIEWIWAQVGWQKDAGGITWEPLVAMGRVGNNQRYRWQVPYEIRNLADWSTVSYAFRFSTDGNTWYRVGQGAGPDGGAARTVKRAFTLPDAAPPSP